MAADKSKQVIIIKKIYENPAGGHGGAWKVAFADFMTAMMCFFLVMWLLNQSDPVKKQIASYFSGPSVLEQNFKAYGAELTFEKLFLDIVNEPLKTIQTIMDPADLSPNILAMGSRKVALKYIEQELGRYKPEISVESDRVTMDFPDESLFERGTANESREFNDIMTRIGVVTRGLEDSTVVIESEMIQESTPEGTYASAQKVSQERADMIAAKVDASFEHATTRMTVRSKIIEERNAEKVKGRPMGRVRITMAQKEITADGHKQRALEDAFSSDKKEMSTYNSEVDRVSKKKRHRQ